MPQIAESNCHFIVRIACCACIREAHFDSHVLWSNRPRGSWTHFGGESIMNTQRDRLAWDRYFHAYAACQPRLAWIPSCLARLGTFKFGCDSDAIPHWGMRISRGVCVDRCVWRELCADRCVWRELSVNRDIWKEVCVCVKRRVWTELYVNRGLKRGVCD